MDSFNAQQYQQNPGSNWNHFPNSMFFAPPPGIPPPPFNFDPRTVPPPPFFFPPNYPHEIPQPQNMSANLYFQPHQSYSNERNYFNGSNAIDDRLTNQADVRVPKRPDDADGLPVLRKWLEARKDLKVTRDSKTSKWSISIPEFKDRLGKVLELAERLKVISRCVAEGQRECRCELKDDDGITLDHEVAIARTQEEMRLIQTSVDSKTVDEVQRKLKERRRKRDRLKRKKERDAKEEEMTEERRAKINEEIDRKIARVAEAEAAVKKEKEVSKEADNILFEVRRKISDVKKSLKTLSAVQKLREVRVSKKSGLMSTDTSDVFNERVREASAFLKRQLDVYESEQRALQVMLNSEHEADREREAMRRKEKMIKEVEKEVNEVFRQLFGDNVITDQADPILPFFQLYDLPNNDISSFLHVRHQWDQYLVSPGTPGASKIPPTWVTPSEPSSQSWSSWVIERPVT